jgi:hypothetical protein
LFLHPVTSTEVSNTILSLSNSRSVGTDGLAPDVIKANSLHIASQLSHVFNLSLSHGIFPKLLKQAIVVPIYKSGSRKDPSNYRPISVLTLFSRLLEKLYYARLLSFLNKHHILHDSQFGFRQGKSTVTAITQVLSSILFKHQANSKVVLTLLDL